MTFGSAWQGAHFELIDKTTEIVPGITLLVLVSEAPGTRSSRNCRSPSTRRRESCWWSVARTPGSTRSSRLPQHKSQDPFDRRRLPPGVAPDDAIAKIVATLKDNFKVENIAPGHCTGEPTFAALKQAFGDHYIYAGVGTSLVTGSGAGAAQRRGEAPALDAEDLVSYRRLAAREDPFGLATWRRKRANTETDGAPTR